MRRLLGSSAPIVTTVLDAVLLRQVGRHGVQRPRVARPEVRRAARRDPVLRADRSMGRQRPGHHIGQRVDHHRVGHLADRQVALRQAARRVDPPVDRRRVARRVVQPAVQRRAGHRGVRARSMATSATGHDRHGQQPVRTLGRVVAHATHGRRAAQQDQEVAVASRPFTIAIDGPAAAGKSTVGEIVARQIDGVYFDSGLLYRATTRLALDRHIDPDDGDALAACTQRASIRVERPSMPGRQNDVIVDGTDVTDLLRTPEVDRAVSQVSQHASVRAALLSTQRQIARSGRVVMVGRDIGTVVLPDAELKVFLDASPEERARRRCEQNRHAVPRPSYAAVLADLRRRDQIDSERDVAPLRPADDAVVIDSDPLTVEEVADRIVAIARDRMQLDQCQ